MARKKVEQGGKDIGDVIFGDLMSQMLTFFILLFIFASQNVSKTEYNSFMDMVREGFVETLEKKEDIQKPKPVVKTKEEVKETLKQMIIQQNLEEYVDVIVDDKKIRLIFDQPILFELGSANLKKDFHRYLSPVGDILKEIPNEIVVEGHTDNIPIHTEKYETNWVLSFHRAYEVLKYLIRKKHISPKRISAVGYGEFRPRVPNDSKHNRSMNRRIEINILYEK